MRTLIGVAALTALALLHIGCTNKVTPATPAPASAAVLDLKGAARQIANDLAQQVSSGTAAPTIVIDPMLDHATGQQTGVSRQLQEETSAPP